MKGQLAALKCFWSGAIKAVRFVMDSQRDRPRDLSLQGPDQSTLYSSNTARQDFFFLLHINVSIVRLFSVIKSMEASI